MPLPPPFRDSDAYAELDATEIDDEMPADDTLEQPFVESVTAVVNTCPHCGHPLPPRTTDKETQC